MEPVNLHTADGAAIKKNGEIVLYLVNAVNTLPSAASGYAKGCIAIDTVNGKLYVNEGTTSSCSFAAIASLTATQEAVLDELSATELGYINGVTAGTAVASKAVVLGGSKEIATLGDVTSTGTVGATAVTGLTVNAGTSGAAGALYVFPTTASKGKLSLACQDQTGNTTVTISAGAMGQASTLTLADPGTAAGYIPTVVDVAPGTGISTGAAICEHTVRRIGNVYKTEILIDLTGLADDDTTGDIIGKPDDTANCHLGLIAAATHGTIFAGKITCFEAPTTGDPDIDLYGSVTEETGAQGAAISGLTGEAQLINHGDWAAEAVDFLTAMPGPGYLYLTVGAGTPDNGTYASGIFLIELWGA